MTCVDCGAEPSTPRARLCAACAKRRRRESGRKQDAKRPGHGNEWHKAKRAEKLATAPSACEICGRLFGTTHWDSPRWDHNHVTGQFRGWLCHQCNVSLGLMNDDSGRLLAAANYLDSRK